MKEELESDSCTDENLSSEVQNISSKEPKTDTNNSSSSVICKKKKPTGKRKKRTRKKPRKPIIEDRKEGEDIVDFTQYSKYPLTDSEMTREAGATCVGYGTGASHEGIILGAGGEIGYDGFRDPRPGQNGPIYADRVFINQKTNEIQGINFNDAQGKFCCSYVGYNYQEIKEYNRSDCDRKQKAELSSSEKSGQEVEYDEYGVPKNNQNSQSHNNNGYNGGIKRS